MGGNGRSYTIFQKMLAATVSFIITAVALWTYVSIEGESAQLRKGMLDDAKHVSEFVASSVQSAFWSLNWIYVDAMLDETVNFMEQKLLFILVAKDTGEIYLSNDDAQQGEQVDKSFLRKEGGLIETCKEHDAALPLLRQAWAAMPGDPDAAAALAPLLLAAANPAEALEVCDAALPRTPRMIALRLSRARALAGVGRIDEAVEAAEAALEDAPEDFRVYAALEEALAAAPPETAAQRWRAIARRFPDSPFAAMKLGNAQMRLGDCAAAADAYAAACALNQNDSAAFAALGNALAAGGRFAEAVTPLRKAIALNPDTPETRLLLVRALKESGDERAARAEARAIEEHGGALPRELLEALGTPAPKQDAP